MEEFLELVLCVYNSQKIVKSEVKMILTALTVYVMFLIGLLL